MRPWWLALLAGCSLIYNPDDLRHDAGPAPDAEKPLVDANPAALALTSVSPTTVDEGVGDDHGRAAVFALHGDSIEPDATLTVTLDPGGAAEMPLTPDAVAISSRGDLVVVAVKIPVLTDLAAGAQRTLRFELAQSGAPAPVDVDAMVQGLDELSDIAQFTSGTTYSRITLASGNHFTGTSAIQLVATAGISVTGTLDVDASGQTGGAGGCNGGAAETPGGCGNGGGRAGSNTTVGLVGAGGGGGGFGDMGIQGSGTMAGTGGVPTGNDMLVPIVTSSGDGNRGGGGGGGGTGTLGTGAGAGGGGGGAIELAAGGDVTITGGVHANGDDGAGSGGGGGGGSGGAILLRAGGTITSGALAATFGQGAASATNPGGDGSVGRIRVDSGGAAPTANPPAIRGPAWDANTPLIAPTRSFSFTLHGQPARSFAVKLDGTAEPDVAIGADGTGSETIELPLDVAVHHLCAFYSTSPTVLTDEAQSCVDVGFTQ